ncbi:MAG: ParB N-terminal domain-containing protein [Pseudomonadota bacterium]
MPRTATLNIPRHAPVEKFQLMHGRILSGSLLDDVRAIEASIARFGLLSPIVAVRRAGRLVVVDGRKRLAAIRRMAFGGTLPRSLARIPYRLVAEAAPAERHAPRFVANRDLFDAVIACHRAGCDTKEIGQAFRISRQCVRDLVSLSRLAPTIREAFFRREIGFDQAHAYTALPDHRTQMNRYAALGSVAHPTAITAPQRPEGEDQALAA